VWGTFAMLNQFHDPAAGLRVELGNFHDEDESALAGRVPFPVKDGQESLMPVARLASSKNGSTNPSCSSVRFSLRISMVLLVVLLVS